MPLEPEPEQVGVCWASGGGFGRRLPGRSGQCTDGCASVRTRRSCWRPAAGSESAQKKLEWEVVVLSVEAGRRGSEQPGAGCGDRLCALWAWPPLHARACVPGDAAQPLRKDHVGHVAAA